MLKYSKKRDTRPFRGFKLIFFVISLLFVLSACTSKEELAELHKTQIESNQQTKNAIYNYNESQEKGAEYTKAIRKNILDNDVSEVKGAYPLSVTDEQHKELRGYVNQLTNIVQDHIREHNESVDNEIEEFKEMLKIDTTDLVEEELERIPDMDEEEAEEYIDELRQGKIFDNEVFLRESMEVFYLLDETTRQTEQYIKIDLGMGQTYDISLIWLGGILFAVESSNLS